MILCYVSKTGQLPFDSLADQHITIEKLPNLQQLAEFYERSSSRDIALLYEISQADEIRQLRDLSFKQNIYVAVFGPADSNLSLLAGKMGADAYIESSQIDLAKLKEQIINSRRNVKERQGNSHVSVFTGIQGGIGTTTIAMNTANLLAKHNPQRKILFLDLAHTKAVSNLFFNTPNPEKTLADVAVNGYNSPELLPNILIKHSSNLFFIPGIQKHADRQELETPDNVRRIVEFIEFAKNYFNDIIIDGGVFEDVNLKNVINEITDSIYVIVEFSIPSVSILKTQLDVVYRYNWAPKTHLLINRYDAQGTFDVAEAIKIIRQDEVYPYKIDFMLPNDSRNLRVAWNEASLLTELFPDTAFIKSLREFIEGHFYSEQAALLAVPDQSLLNGINKPWQKRLLGLLGLK
jgi:pilus assembly protein CpaE